MMHYYYGHFWWGPILMILFWIFLIMLVAWVVRAIFRERGYPGHPGMGRWQESAGPGAREILDQRYARGEISRDVYLAMKKDLNTNPATGSITYPDNPA